MTTLGAYLSMIHEVPSQKARVHVILLVCRGNNGMNNTVFVQEFFVHEKVKKCTVGK